MRTRWRRCPPNGPSPAPTFSAERVMAGSACSKLRNASRERGIIAQLHWRHKFRRFDGAQLLAERWPSADQPSLGLHPIIRLNAMRCAWQRMDYRVGLQSVGLPRRDCTHNSCRLRTPEAAAKQQLCWITSAISPPESIKPQFPNGIVSFVSFVSTTNTARGSGLGVAHDLTRVADRLQIAGDDFVERRSFRAGDLDDTISRHRERHIGNDDSDVVRRDGLEQAGHKPDDVSIRT